MNPSECCFNYLKYFRTVSGRTWEDLVGNVCACSLHHHVVHAANNNTVHHDIGCLDSSKIQSSAGSVLQWLEPTHIEEQEMSRWLMLHSDYAKTSVMFFSLWLNTLSSVVQLIKRREEGGLTVQRNHHWWFWFFVFFTSLSVHIHYLWPPPRSLPYRPVLFVWTRGTLVKSWDARQAVRLLSEDAFQNSLCRAKE